MKLGEVIGKGQNRIVYQHPDNKDLVVKVSSRFKNGYDHNKIEWDIWNAVKGTKYEKYFAPCIDFIDNKYLIMQKCDKVKGLNPNKLPGLDYRITDSQSSKNRGVFKNRIVIVDYGASKNLKFIEFIEKK